jgi:hypothetical protein
MRILAFDSGARRAGWAMLENQWWGIEFDSDVISFPRESKELYQDYRMRLAQFWTFKTLDLIHDLNPDHIVTETVPVYGMNDFSQGYLANVMATTVHAVAFIQGITVAQVSARKVQSAIAIGGKTKKPTKPQVRNGVIERLPEVKDTLKSEMKVFERSDALAIGLWYLNL